MWWIRAMVSKYQTEALCNSPVYLRNKGKHICTKRLWTSVENPVEKDTDASGEFMAC